ncbi:SulP family inorganic anion transporter [Alteromonas macleodii]|jgi:SulP family sulfate permease|uniref:Bicarbonate transporter BicA n=1 Tax=Alteromonas marina TaxID=203795 RepID=A0A0B3XZS5_9ALTE|nr:MULTISPECIES: SulP family inorganic anion transporter [Alteromonas]MAN43758.1 SulP family inorganic anion transporter [Alteromonas sp.]MCG8498400.1 SulP family inorganic anion transporter [Enterobacterales bacterium]MEC7699482.1 SulP family inorganic anion transporter [Pseudomonadota bacterium]AFS36553.1 low affinity sulfate transporter [Alteromonas macleodii ATCC 27126]AMN11064.1 Bicarbonate transporter BicA [Alteromonas macleodii]|tara:strand:+ start:1390 stop:3027 length:1638 start_codon:yes stop_codon:yes gene_type:complete
MVKINLSNLRGDFTGGLTAGIVALPLALALGVASGLGPMAGLYGAIAVGFFAALFGGTPAQISGPTGPMVVVLAGLFASLSGDASLIFTAVILAGIFQIVFGVLGVGQYIRLVPYPVISGFMSGIGAIIIILQIGRLLGHEPPGGTIGALTYLPTALADIDFATLALGLGTLVIAYKWPPQLGKYVPGALAALIIGTLVSLALSVPILGDIPTGLPSLHLPVFDQSKALLILEAAFILAVLGAIDSLLTSLVADNMTRTRHDSNKELIGQGIGNTFAGLIGGIAGAGATMRTVVNIRSGGKYNISGMVHALVLLAIVLGLSPLAAQIPHAVLAGILVKVGLDIIDWSYLKRAHKGPRWDFGLMIMVLALTVFVDLITAVGVGVVFAALAYVKQIAQLQIEELKKIPESLNDPKENELLESLKDKVSIFSFGGPLSFGAAADLGHHVRERVKPGSKVTILDFSRVPLMDVSAAMAVDTVTSDALAAGRQLVICGANAEVNKVLEGVNEAHPGIPNFDTLHDALLYAEKQVAGTESKNTRFQAATQS